MTPPGDGRIFRKSKRFLRSMLQYSFCGLAETYFVEGFVLESQSTGPDSREPPVLQTKRLCCEMTKLLSLGNKLGAIILLVFLTETNAFTPTIIVSPRNRHLNSLIRVSSHNSGPPDWSSSQPTPDDNGQDDEVPPSEEGQANTRFSAFAPDPNLSADDFRSQLKENMKADLERRRREDPGRGNQPAKTYLDSL
jgi:hypothetical protein